MIWYIVQASSAHGIDQLASALGVAGQALVLVGTLHRLTLYKFGKTVSQTRLILDGDGQIAERLGAGRDVTTRSLHLSSQSTREHPVERVSGGRVWQTLLQGAHEDRVETVYVFLVVDRDVQVFGQCLSVNELYV